MSMLVSSLLFVALLAVAFAHFIWALGFTWPIRTEKLLAQTVVGTAGAERMPPRWYSLLVAVAALGVGILALSLADHDSGGWALTLSALPFAAVFLLRGVMGYSQWWARQRPETNYRLSDRRVYSPVYLLLGLGFLILLVMRLS